VSRLAILRAVTAGALDRATDVAATLEIRGFGTGARPPRMHRPWSRHDYAFAASALALLAIAAGSFAWIDFDAYPRLHAPLDAATLLAIAALVVCALLPFADRRGIVR
jgi:energy-coupling factor transport system permease protein